MKTIQRILPYAIGSILLFYGCPFAARSLHTSLMLVILVTPFVCMAIGYIDSKHHKVDVVLPVISGLLSIPAIYFFYTSTAWCYPIFFGISILIGEIGAELRKQLANA